MNNLKIDMIFTYKQYENFLIELNNLGHTRLFRDWKGEHVFLLRHDVDFDISLACKLAAIENKNNIVSTFFILTTCEHYNILSSKNKAFLREIISMGHEIGLHFDPTIYDGNLADAVKKEIEILSFTVGEDVKSISLHNPSVHGKYPVFDGYINAYDPKIFSDENYISDSRFIFRGKNIYEFIKKIDTSMIQILLHPMHYSENGGGYDDIMCDALIRRMNNIHDDFKVNKTYLEHVGNDLTSAFIRKIK